MASAERLPLTMPPELWAGLGDELRNIFRLAQAILDCLMVPERLAVEEACSRVGQAMGSLLPAFRLLEAIGLIRLGEGRTVVLLARPSDHVKFVGPDGRRRWIFVATPVSAPEASPETLN